MPHVTSHTDEANFVGNFSAMRLFHRSRVQRQPSALNSPSIPDRATPWMVMGTDQFP